TVEREGGWLGADQRGGATVAEQEERQQPIEVVSFLQVERAQLEADDQHPGGGHGAHKVVCQAQGIDRGVATHKANYGALDRRVEATSPHQLEVDPGGGKS